MSVQSLTGRCQGFSHAVKRCPPIAYHAGFVPPLPGLTPVPLDTRRSPYAHWRTLPPNAFRLSTGFWSSRQTTNAERSLSHGYRMLEEAGNLNNLRLAAGQGQGEYKGPVFQDSDVYKWLEAMAYQMALGLSPELQAQCGRDHRAHSRCPGRRRLSGFLLPGGCAASALDRYPPRPRAVLRGASDPGRGRLSSAAPATGAC